MTRIVFCPGCKELLVEPTAGVALYQCAKCSMVLIAKHARSSLSPQPSNAPPLYQQRERQPVALPAPTATAPREASIPPLYTPRQESGRLSSAAGAAATPTAIDDQASSLLLQDMRKLAREAFPGPAHSPERRNPKENGMTGRVTRQELDEFTFHRPADDLDATSDYHSTRDELESSAQSDDLRRNGYLERTRLPDHTLVAGNGYDTATSSSDPSRQEQQPLQQNKEELAIVPVTTPSPPVRKTRPYPPLKYPYVVCQHCHKVLEVPRDLPPSKSGVQKLRCGDCQNVSKFTLVNDRSGFIVPATTNTSQPSMNNNNNTDRDGIHENMSMVISAASSPRSPAPSTGSAPASFHHRLAGGARNQRMSNNNNNINNNKGYDSAPELHHGASASTSSSHARTISAGSTSTVPLAPCLHELFGYDTPSQFFKVSDSKSSGSSKSSEPLSPTQPKPQGLKGLLLKSIQDISRLHFQQPHYTKVTINGRVIPSERVRKAEEQAGPIHPGCYWYDYRAGFWGVLGGPCIGIIPPCIDEFKFPAMPVNCAGGKTKVLVNGRELHQQDLQVLVKRGLPATPNMAYTIDAEGVVVEDATGVEIVCLGKLAPSIEKRGVGFGMFPLLT